jgi:hypothetical protein
MPDLPRTCSRPFGLGLDHDAEHTLGLILCQLEGRHGVLDWEPVGDQSAGELRAGSQKIGSLGEIRAPVVAAVAERGTEGDFLTWRYRTKSFSW